MSSTDSNSSNSPLSPSSSTPTNADAEASGTKTNTDPQTKSVSQDLRAGALDSNDLEGLDAKKLTKFYRVPNARFKTPEDIIKYYGYELKEKIAEGGFGVIYKAVHIKTKVEVACKQMDMTKGKCLKTRSSFQTTKTSFNQNSSFQTGRPVTAGHKDRRLKDDGHEKRAVHPPKDGQRL